MIPPFDASGNLPKGVHLADWDEIAARFGGTAHRRLLLAGLLRALQNLRDAGCAFAYLDGSFVTAVDHPRDFDACWEAAGVDLSKLDPILKTFSHGRALQKAKYLGELFPARVAANPSGRAFLDFFQIDKATGNAKGIVGLELKGLPR